MTRLFKIWLEDDFNLCTLLAAHVTINNENGPVTFGVQTDMMYTQPSILWTRIQRISYLTDKMCSPEGATDDYFYLAFVHSAKILSSRWRVEWEGRIPAMLDPHFHIISLPHPHPWGWGITAIY